MGRTNATRRRRVASDCSTPWTLPRPKGCDGIAPHTFMYPVSRESACRGATQLLFPIGLTTGKTNCHAALCHQSGLFNATLFTIRRQSSTTIRWSMTLPVKARSRDSLHSHDNVARPPASRSRPNKLHPRTLVDLPDSARAAKEAFRPKSLPPPP